MQEYIIRRIATTLLLAWVVASLIFFLIYLLPGDPAMAVLGGMNATPTEEALEQVRQQLGLDRPLYVQYTDWLGNVIRGHFGESFTMTHTVGQILLTRFPRTALLIVPAVILAVGIGIPLGILAARYRGTVTDPLASMFALSGISIPSFVVGTILILIFAVELQLLPAIGYVNPLEDLGGFLQRALLPIVTLSLSPLAIVMRMTRSSFLEEVSADYVRTARSKGLTERVVIYRHVLKNALIPVVTVVALSFGYMFAGSVIVEYIFNWPGLNALLLEAIGVRDYPVVQGIVLVTALMFITANLLADIAYGFLDPTIRYD